MEQRSAEAYLECAGRFAARGDKQAAFTVYKQLIAPREAPMVRVAALAGLAKNSPNDAVPLLATEMESKDVRVQFAAIRFLNGIPGSDATAEMQRAFPRLGAEGKVRLLGALADRGDVSSRPLFASAVKDGSPNVRAAALGGLGVVGDSSSVAVLADAASNGIPAEQAAARRSLNTLHGAGVDAAFASALASSHGKVKAELLASAGERGSADAADAVLQSIRDSDPDVHREATKALKNVAGARQVPALVDLVANASSANDRRDLGQALAVVLQRSGPGAVAPVVSAYKGTTNAQVRAAFIDTLGRTSSPDALPVLKAALADPSADIVRASVLALTEWQTPAPMPDLLTIAKTPANPALGILALRGYVKLAGLPSERPNTESAKLLVPAAELAKEPAEKRALLAVLANYPCKESLDLIQSMTNDPAVTAEAKTAATRMEATMRRAGGTQR
jgi:HEAT repeat protein